MTTQDERGQFDPLTYSSYSYGLFVHLRVFLVVVLVEGEIAQVYESCGFVARDDADDFFPVRIKKQEICKTRGRGLTYHVYLHKYRGSFVATGIRV